MSVNLVRMRFAAVAAKIEVTPGTDSIAGTPAANDWMASDCEVDFDPVVVDNPELTGSLDRAPGIVGGLRPVLRLRLPLRGSGVVGTAPDFGKLLRCCTYAETVNTAITATALPASGHTTTSITLPSSPYVATSQIYRGQPLVLTGAVVDTTAITDYTAARVATLGSTLSAVPAATTNAAIPANVLYSPTSDETVYRTATLYFYADGFRWTFVGAVGNWSIELTTGGIAYLTFEMRAQFGAKTFTALPAGAFTTRPTPPRFVGGRCQLNQTAAQARRLAFDAGVRVTLPDAPEQSDGFGPAVPIERDSRGSIDPLLDTTISLGQFNNFRNGTNMTIMAIIGATAGNRFLITAPAARALSYRVGARDGLGQADIAFALDGADSDLFIAQF